MRLGDNIIEAIPQPGVFVIIADRGMMEQIHDALVETDLHTVFCLALLKESAVIELVSDPSSAVIELVSDPSSPDDN